MMFEMQTILRSLLIVSTVASVGCSTIPTKDIAKYCYVAPDQREVAPPENAKALLTIAKNASQKIYSKSPWDNDLRSAWFLSTNGELTLCRYLPPANDSACISGYDTFHKDGDRWSISKASEPLCVD